MTSPHEPEPGTEEAIAAGCTCVLLPPNPHGFDPTPVLKRDKWCALHGKDPDAERDKIRDRQ